MTVGGEALSESVARARVRHQAERLRAGARNFFGRRDGLVGGVILISFAILAMFPDLIVGPLETVVTATGGRFEPPSATHIFGTDRQGRDMLNLTVHGTRVSMIIGLLATLITVFIGALLGIVSGFLGGRTDTVLMRLTDFFLVLPTFVLALILAPILIEIIGSQAEFLGMRVTLVVIVIVIGITSWASTARIIRSQTGGGRRPRLDHAQAHPAQRGQPDRGQHGHHLRRRRPDRDDAVVHRPGRSIPAVVGSAPQPGPGRRRGQPRGVVGGRPAGCIHRPGRARLHPGRGRPGRHPQSEAAGAPVTAHDLDPTPAAVVEPDGRTTVRGRRQWPLPKQAVPDARLLEVRDLAVHFALPNASVQAVRGVDFHLDDGEALGIAGESGCGKTTTALSLVRLLPSNAKIASGSVNLYGIDLVPKTEKQLQRYRWREIAIVFQGAMNALNPVQRVRDQIAEPVELRLGLDRSTSRKRAGDLLELVGIPRKRGAAYPHELSGGMRQRAMIAMALACDPAVVIGDEPTTALDVMVQAQILELLERLRHELGLSLILITHDLSVLAETCDRVLVMYAGKVAE
jgi:ABC-type dipeptide/oligopeptide/nickel transport system ATPase component